MSTNFPLEAVMDLTRRQADAAAAALARLRASERAALQTLQMLEVCRRDYQSQLERTSEAGIGNEQWRNYQEFLRKIDQALAQQKQALAKCSTECQASLHEWQLAHVRLKSFDILLQRHQRGEMRRESRKEQREQDERSAASQQHEQHPHR